MEALEKDTQDIHFLITQLCRQLLPKTCTDSEKKVKKLKFLAYEVILKKTLRPPCIKINYERKKFNALHELRAELFANKLQYHFQPTKYEELEKFEELVNDIDAEPYFKNKEGENILQMLLLLQVPDDETLHSFESQLLIPGPFTLHAGGNILNNYPMETVTSGINHILHPKLRYFQEINKKTPKFMDAFKSKFFTEPPKNPSYDIASNHFKLPKIESTINVKSTTFRNPMRINVRPFSLYENDFTDKTFADTVKNTYEINGLLPIMDVQGSKQLPETPAEEKEIKKAIEKKVFSWSWEELGSLGITCNKPFVSETNVTLNIQCINQQKQGLEFEAKLISQQQFIHDLKCLSVGIQSDCFLLNSHVIYSMEPNITIDGVLPATVENYVKDFLNCGTCYKRLQLMTFKKDYKLIYDGFMFRALSSAIDDYLLAFRHYVYAQEDTTLLGLYRRMRKMMRQINNLAHTLAFHPNVDKNVKPPLGSKFLVYLYQEIVRLTDQDYLTVLMFIIKRCCHVYFKHLQKWIFYGILDDSSYELFIGFIDHYRPHTKYFYDKAYFIRKEIVPGFFQNHEDSILQCGKYTMLLKAYKPNHPLFDLEYPEISVCLSFDEIKQLEINCFKYFERATEIFGKPLSIGEIFEKRKKSQHDFFKTAKTRARENMNKWLEEQKQIMVHKAETKRTRFRELTEQLEISRQNKLTDRRASIESELRRLEEQKSREDDLLMKENINLVKRIEYYQEINELLSYPSSNTPSKRGHLSIPSSSRSLNTELSTGSSASADYESCVGEDFSSDYSECLSHGFAHKFEAVGEELKILYHRNVELISLNSNATDIMNSEDLGNKINNTMKLEKSNSANDLKSISDNNVSFLKDSTLPKLQRSASDVINSNTINNTDLQKNRNQMLSGNSIELCMKYADTSDVHIINDLKEQLTCDTVKDDTQVFLIPDIPKPTSSLTEAQKNKLKIMTQKFEFEESDVNLNMLNSPILRPLSEMEKNRNRMMQNDLFLEYNKEPLFDRPTFLNLDSELARNRRKVLNSEFHILTGESCDASTPMSTTSDTPIVESPSNGEVTHDAQNGNLNEINNLTLKLDTQLVNFNNDKVKFSEDTIVVDITPDEALNTAGISARNGFNFDMKEKKRVDNFIPALLPTIDEDNVNETTVETDSISPYSRCIELLESNFKCPGRCNFVNWPFLSNKTTKSSEKMKKIEENNDVADNIDSEGKLIKDITLLNVITLTDFLTKSVIIPVSTHLELVKNEVMRMFLEDLNILEHFRNLRNYFFLIDGEFGSIISDGIIEKLENGVMPKQLLSFQMLHSILDNALNSTLLGANKYASNLSFIVGDCPENFNLKSPNVLNIVTLSYKIHWPLNLILNPETIEQYSNVFKYLMKVRRISWVLEHSYQLLKEAVKRHGYNLLKSPQYRHIQLIRHKLYHFVHSLQNHITANALQASWKVFKDELNQAKSIEDIYRKHTIYLKRILFLCMLNRRSGEFYNTIDNIFKISLKFYNNLKSKSFELHPNMEHFTHWRYEKMVKDNVEFDKLVQFVIYLGNKIVKRGYQDEIGVLINLINFNRYYAL